MGEEEVPDNALAPKDHMLKGLRTCQSLPSKEMCGEGCDLWIMKVMHFQSPSRIKGFSGGNAVILPFHFFLPFLLLLPLEFFPTPTPNRYLNSDFWIKHATCALSIPLKIHCPTVLFFCYHWDRLNHKLHLDFPVKQRIVGRGLDRGSHQA